MRKIGYRYNPLFNNYEVYGTMGSRVTVRQLTDNMHMAQLYVLYYKVKAFFNIGV